MIYKIMKHTMKRMKVYSFLLLGCLSFHALDGVAAATEARSQIKEVMVYATGAMVKRTANVNAKSGTTEVKIPLLTPLLEQNSIQVGVKGGSVTLASIKYDVEIPDRKQIGKEVEDLTRRSSALRDSIDILMGKSGVLDKERELILKSNNIGGDNGFTAPTLQGITSYVRKDLNEIINMQYAYQQKIRKCQDELVVNEQKVNLLYEKQMEPMSVVLVTLDAPYGTNCELEISYFVKNAAWMPFYEARIDRNDTKLHLVQKAYISQGSKEMWPNVDLILSQNDPSVSNEKPELGRYSIPSCQYIGKKIHTVSNDNPYVKVMGVVRDRKGPLKDALVTCGEDRKTQTDANGYYELLVPKNSTVKYDYTGYKTAQSSVDGKNAVIKNVNMETNSSQVLENRMDKKYLNYIDQNRSSNALVAIHIDSKPKSGIESDIPLMIIRNVTDNVPGKNTIPDDGADHEVMVKDILVDAEYNYFAVPKLSKDVYMVASIPDWKKLDLLDGNVKIYLNNVYMGESFINARQVEDTLNLSIGKDRELAVDRKDLKTYASKGLIKSSDKVEREWLITVKNNKSKSVKITVEDQFPVSTSDDVKVVLIDNGGAEVDEKEGKLTWKLNLKPNEKKELKFSYSVKSKGRGFTVD